MRKALRYLKPFWFSVVCIIALVFGQVQCELALPDYMSDIVTNGIQNGGIEDSTITAIRSSSMDHLLLFANEEDKETIQNSYTYIEKGDVSYISTYPALENESIYVLNQDAPKTIKDYTSKPFLISSMLESEEAQSAMPLPEGMDIYDAIESNPQMKDTILQKVDEQMASYSSDNLESGAIVLLKNEYSALGMNTDKMQMDYIFHAGLLMLVIALVGSVFAILAAYLSSRTATGACRNMRKDVFEKVESFSNTEFSKFSTASLITRTTNDIQQVQQILTMLLRIVLFAPLMGFTALFKVIRYPSMLWILGLVLALIILLFVITFSVTMPKFKIIQKLVDKLNLVMREFLDGMLVIRAFNTQKHEEKRFDNANLDITKVNLFVNRTMAVVMPIMTFLMSAVSVLIIWFAAKQIDLGTMQIGAMLAFIQYAMHVLMSFMIVAMISIMIPRSAVSAERIFEVLETDLSIKDPQSPKQLPVQNAPISFDHVSFKYPGAEENVLSDITFNANPGETIAFIGSTGSGKSTLINLLPRFFDVTEGSITIDGINIKDVTQHDLRSKIGYVPQKGILFSGDIESNLRYGDQNATNETIENAIEVSQSKEFIDSKQEGIKEPIAQGGTNVSGGQKQRLSIARALAKNANMYIFDDSFSALDYKTDAKLRDALNKMIASTKSTVFIVAQRISTIMHADKIIVLDNGKIVGMGTHEDLLKNCDVYQEIAYSQLSKEELAHE